MPRRKTHKRSSEVSRYAIAVAAASARVGRTGPDILTMRPDGESDTSIYIEGALDRAVIRMRSANILVLCGERGDGDPGGAVGGTNIWRIVVRLPRAQFADLLSLVLADKLVKVDMLLGPVRYGKGTVRSISFEMRPVPSEAENG